MKAPIVIERYADNGEHSHYELVDAETHEVLWGSGEEDSSKPIDLCTGCIHNYTDDEACPLCEDGSNYISGKPNVKCSFCGQPCEPAPTERGWSSAFDMFHGLHFDCARKVAYVADKIDQAEKREEHHTIDNHICYHGGFERATEYIDCENTDCKTCQCNQEEIKKGDIEITCPYCGGDGYITDHSLEHYGNMQDTDCSKYGCPIQVPCEHCNGTGSI